MYDKLHLLSQLAIGQLVFRPCVKPRRCVRRESICELEFSSDEVLAVAGVGEWVLRFWRGMFGELT